MQTRCNRIYFTFHYVCYSIWSSRYLMYYAYPHLSVYSAKIVISTNSRWAGEVGWPGGDKSQPTVAAPLHIEIFINNFLKWLVLHLYLVLYGHLPYFTFLNNHLILNCWIGFLSLIILLQLILKAFILLLTSLLVIFKCFIFWSFVLSISSAFCLLNIIQEHFLCIVLSSGSKLEFLLHTSFNGSINHLICTIYKAASCNSIQEPCTGLHTSCAASLPPQLLWSNGCIKIPVEKSFQFKIIAEVLVLVDHHTVLHFSWAFPYE